MLWWWLLTGCFPVPTETGPGGMVGHVLDAEGAPVEGLAVETAEARVVTDAEGRFAIRYKEPEQFVHFRWGGAWYRRVYQPADEGEVLTVPLPHLRAPLLVCAVDTPCDLELRWDLGEGLHARASTRCEPGREIELQAVPSPSPEATCRPRPGVDPLQARLQDSGEALRLLPPLVPVQVEVVGEEGRQPRRCTVRIDDEEAEPVGPLSFVAKASGPITVTATCDGRPALPRTVQATPDTTVALAWSPTGPVLDFAGALPVPADLWLVADDEERPGWLLQIPPDDEGLFHLPPLPEGSYRVAVGDPALLAALEPGAEPPAPGVLQAMAVRPGDPVSPGGVAGRLRVEEDLVEGRVPIEGL